MMKKRILFTALFSLMVVVALAQVSLDEAAPEILRRGILRAVDASELSFTEFRSAVAVAFPGKEDLVGVEDCYMTRTDFLLNLIKVLGLESQAAQYAQVVTMANDEAKVSEEAAGAFSVAFRSDRQLLNYRYGHTLQPNALITKEEAALSFYMALYPPVRGGSITTRVGADAPGFNTLFTSSGLTWTICNIIGDGLLGTNQDGFYHPRMIREIPSLENGLIQIHVDGSVAITYHLREGMKWHDGYPVTAHDAKFQWEVMVSGAPVTSNHYELAASSVEVLDDLTYVVHFDEVFGSAWFGSSEYAFYFGWFQLPKHIFEQDFLKAKERGIWDDFVLKVTRNPVMTGPYKFKEYREGQYVVLEAFDEYFMGRPNIDTIVMRIIPDGDVAFAAAKNGEIDFGRYTLSLRHTMQLAQEHGDMFKAYLVPNIAPDLIFLNFRNPDNLSEPNFFFSDLRVRQAIAHAINREAINNLIYNGTGDIAVSWITELHMMREALAHPDIQRYPYDLAKAKALLEQAGWRTNRSGVYEKDGRALQFDLLVGAGEPDYLTMAQMIQGMLRQAGITMEIKTIPPVAMWEIMPQGEYNAILSGWGYGISAEAAEYWTADAIPSEANSFGGVNYSAWSNEENDWIVVHAGATVDSQEKRELYERHLVLWSEALPYVPLVCPPTPIFAKNNIKAFNAGYDNGIGWIIQNWFIRK